MSGWNSGDGARCGFTLVELGAVLAVGAIGLGVAVPTMQAVRRGGQDAASQQNLSDIGTLASMFASDNEGEIFSFTFEGGDVIEHPIFGNPLTLVNDQVAAAYQTQQILVDATGLDSGVGRILTPTSRLMYRRWSHLMLADYAGGIVSDPLWADPADANLLAWQADPLGYLTGDSGFPYARAGVPDDVDPDPNWNNASIIQLWPFASSYQVVPHAWLPDFGASYVPIDSTPHLFTVSDPGQDIELGDRAFDEVAHPSALVHMFEEFDREQAGDPYFAYHHARPAKLMFDGSINTRRSGEATRSVSPEAYNEGVFDPWRQRYVRLDTFPKPLQRFGFDFEVSMRYRWTLFGLQGIDYPGGDPGFGTGPVPSFGGR